MNSILTFFKVCAYRADLERLMGIMQQFLLSDKLSMAQIEELESASQQMLLLCDKILKINAGESSIILLGYQNSQFRIYLESEQGQQPMNQ